MNETRWEGGDWIHLAHNLKNCAWIVCEYGNGSCRLRKIPEICWLPGQLTAYHVWVRRKESAGKHVIVTPCWHLLNGNVADNTTSVYCGLIGVPLGRGWVKGGEGGRAFDDSASNSRQLYRTRRVAGTRLTRGRKFPNIPELAVYVVVGPLTLDRGHVRKKRGGGKGVLGLRSRWSLSVWWQGKMKCTDTKDSARIFFSERKSVSTLSACNDLSELCDIQYLCSGWAAK